MGLNEYVQWIATASEKRRKMNTIMELLERWATPDVPMKAKDLARYANVTERELRHIISEIDTDPNFDEKVDSNQRGYWLTRDMSKKRKREWKRISRSFARLKEYDRIDHDKTQIKFFDSLEEWVNSFEND